MEVWSGTISRVEPDGRCMVELPRRAPGFVVGPCPVVRPLRLPGLTTTDSLGEFGAASRAVVVEQVLVRGARVLVAQYDAPDEYVIIGGL